MRHKCRLRETGWAEFMKRFLYQYKLANFLLSLYKTLCKERRQLCTNNVNFARTTTTLCEQCSYFVRTTSTLQGQHKKLSPFSAVSKLTPLVEFPSTAPNQKYLRGPDALGYFIHSLNHAVRLNVW